MENSSALSEDMDLYQFGVSVPIMGQCLASNIYLNPPPPSDAVRKQGKNIFQRIFLVQYCHNLKNITPLRTLNLII